jgi:hypothetical protein
MVSPPTSARTTSDISILTSMPAWILAFTITVEPLLSSMLDEKKECGAATKDPLKSKPLGDTAVRLTAPAELTATNSKRMLEVDPTAFILPTRSTCTLLS